MKAQKIGSNCKKRTKTNTTNKTKTKNKKKELKLKPTWCNTMISERNKYLLVLLGNCCTVIKSEVKVEMRS
jgi:hypothetical protein